MKDIKVFIVTPVFNAEGHIVKFAESIKRQTYKNISAVIVNDGSTDNTAKLIKNNFPDTVLLEGDGDLWWSGCTNMGVRYAIEKGADYVLTVNVDVVLSNTCVEELVNAAKKIPKALIGSVVCDIKDKSRVWYYGGYWNRNEGDLVHASGMIQDVGKDIIHPEWLTGMGALIPVTAFNKVGFYDEVNFPHYFGDSDFSLRAAQAGYELVVLPDAIVYADLSSSWLEKWLAKPSLSFFWNLFFSRRSQFNLVKRYLFYKRHWGKGYIRALIKLYFISMFRIYRLWFVLFSKRILGRI